MKALIVGHAEPAAALTSALSERGMDAELHAVPRPPEERAVTELAQALVEIEGKLAGDAPKVAIAVGTGDAPTALAITAAKLGVPLVAWVDNGAGEDDMERGERRILATLADFDAGPVGDGVAAFEAADRIASWAEINLSG